MTCPKTNNRCERNDCLVECQSKGFIYLHPVDGFTFLENVPEKPIYDHDNFGSEESLKYESDCEAYERALAEAIEKRMVIDNPEVFAYKDGDWYCWKHDVMPNHADKFIKEGELYSWPGIHYTNDNKTSVRLIAPNNKPLLETEEDAKIADYEHHYELHTPERIKSNPDERPLAVEGSQVVGVINEDEVIKEIASMAWKGAANAFRMYPENKHTFAEYWDAANQQFKKFTLLNESQRTIATDHTEPVVSQDQEELWLDVLDDLETGYSDKVNSRIIEEMKKKFTITRNP